jgi:hypothetical protein
MDEPHVLIFQDQSPQRAAALKHREAEEKKKKKLAKGTRASEGASGCSSTAALEKKKRRGAPKAGGSKRLRLEKLIFPKSPLRATGDSKDAMDVERSPIADTHVAAATSITDPLVIKSDQESERDDEAARISAEVIVDSPAPATRPREAGSVEVALSSRHALSSSLSSSSSYSSSSSQGKTTSFEKDAAATSASPTHEAPRNDDAAQGELRRTDRAFTTCRLPHKSVGWNTTQGNYQT